MKKLIGSFIVVSTLVVAIGCGSDKGGDENQNANPYNPYGTNYGGVCSGGGSRTMAELDQDLNTLRPVFQNVLNASNIMENQGNETLELWGIPIVTLNWGWGATVDPQAAQNYRNQIQTFINQAEQFRQKYCPPVSFTLNSYYGNQNMAFTLSPQEVQGYDLRNPCYFVSNCWANPSDPRQYASCKLSGVNYALAYSYCEAQKVDQWVGYNGGW